MGLQIYQVCSDDGRRLTFDLSLQDKICTFIYLNGQNDWLLQFATYDLSSKKF